MNPGVRACTGTTDIWFRHADLPEIAVLPELTLGGVQMDLTQALIRDAETGWLGNPPGVESMDKEKASNDSTWRKSA